MNDAAATTINRVLATEWTACWAHDFFSHNHSCPPNRWRVDRLPTTALSVLLDAHQIPQARCNGITSENLLHSQNLARLPDISDIGSDFYTLVYEFQIGLLDLSSWMEQETFKAENYADIVYLEISGVNYETTLYLEGEWIPRLDFVDVDLSNEDDSTTARKNLTSSNGMFLRQSYILPKRLLHASNSTLSILVKPPQPAGIPQAGTQGGFDHALAQVGPTAHFLLGWDWISPIPDRSTGFWGQPPRLERLFSWLKLANAAIQTLWVQPDELGLLGVVQLQVVKQTTMSPQQKIGIWKRLTLQVDASWGQAWKFSLSDDQIASLARCESTNHAYANVVCALDWKLHEMTVTRRDSNAPRLWWPHDMESGPFLHAFTFQLQLEDQRLSETVVRVGLRTVETYVDSTTQGRVFAVNGVPLYLAGGNWITLDATFGRSGSRRRYCQELALHKHAGLNWIRVWGGGVAESDAFYDCADELGLLVYQEFWMTGDNNGRWAGNYSWPKNPQDFVSNVKDTILRLRQHASLLFYGGCNECLGPPGIQNPPPVFQESTQKLLDRYDPGRFYIPSSMGGPNVADSFVNPSLWYDRTFSLAFYDGPYGMLWDGEFFERNPGASASALVPNGFQPEIGSVSSPTYAGLRRFLTKHELEQGVPKRNSGSAGPTWEFHKFQAWTRPIPESNSTFDHVYAYFPYPVMHLNASDWTAAAQLAAHAQYQSMMNGFVVRMYEYTTAVAIWKTQSPWPSMRGFLYDWYLESTGMLYGVRAALYKNISVVLDRSTWNLWLVNRSSRRLVHETTNACVGAKVEWYDIGGSLISSEEYCLEEAFVDSMRASPLVSPNKNKNSSVVFPQACGAVCFLRLEYVAENVTMNSQDNFVSWHWLTEPKQGRGPDFSDMGVWRWTKKGKANLSIVSMDMEHEATVGSSHHLQVSVAVRVPDDATEVLFYPTFSVTALCENQNEEVLLPLFDDSSIHVVVLPQSTETRRLRVPTPASCANGQFPVLRVAMQAWNAPMVSAYGNGVARSALDKALAI